MDYELDPYEYDDYEFDMPISEMQQFMDLI
jgi:hypothetical protein